MTDDEDMAVFLARAHKSTEAARGRKFLNVLCAENPLRLALIQHHIAATLVEWQTRKGKACG